MLNRFYTIPERDGHTDGRTVSALTRDKNVWSGRQLRGIHHQTKYVSFSRNVSSIA